MSDTTPWFIYALIDPRTESVRYVGKTTDCVRRLRDHLGRARRDVPNPRYSGNWLRQLIAAGLKPTLQVLEVGVGDSWPDREEWWLQHYRNLGARLTNLIAGGTSGARGHTVSEEARARIGQMNRGRKVSDETRARMSAAHRGKKQTPEHVEKRAAQLRGRQMPSDVVERLSALRRGRKSSDETRAKISAAMLALGPREFSDEARANIAASNKSRVWTDEVRAEMSAQRVGKPLSEETRAKMSASRTGKKRGPYKPSHYSPSEENRAKTAAANRARVWTDESRAKVSASQKGKPRPRKTDEQSPQGEPVVETGVPPSQE